MWGALDSDVDVGVYGGRDGSDGGEIIGMDWISLFRQIRRIISIILFIQNINLKKMNRY